MKYKFTNAYRASDRVSQYLIKQVIYRGSQEPEEVFFRTILFKIFNRIETWERLNKELGEISAAEYSFERYDAILTKALTDGDKIFSAAYIMPSGNTIFGHSRKHRNYLLLLEQLLREAAPYRIADMRTMRDVFEYLRAFPLLGDFLAYQFTIDLNYSPLINFSEMEFVVPGPGAKNGIQKCFRVTGGLNDADIIRLMTENQSKEFERYDINFQSLWGRPLQLIDCQNLFCEIDKYARVAYPDITGISGRSKIKQSFRASGGIIRYWYPPKWGINELIAEEH